MTAEERRQAEIRSIMAMTNANEKKEEKKAPANKKKEKK